MPRWLLAAVGYGLVVLAWVFATPAGAGPNESANLVRAEAVGLGQWDGRPVAPAGAASGLTPAQAAFRARQTREFTLPAGLVPPPICFLGREDVSAACLQRPEGANAALTVGAASDVAGYPPFIYVLPGLTVRWAGDWVTAAYVGRLALAALSVLLITGAAWVLGRRSALWSLAGLVLALTPLVVAEAALLSPAGVEAAAAIAFAAALVAASLWSVEGGANTLAVLGMSGAVLALARPLGVAAVVALAAVTLPLTGLRWLLSRAGFVALVLLAAGGGIGVLWAQAHQPLPTVDFESVLAGTAHVADRALPLLRQQISGSGWLDVTLPSAVTVGWAALLALVAVGAFVVGRWRERLVLLLAVAAAAVLGGALYELVLRPAALDIQGRYLLPVLVLVPLVSGFVLQRVRPEPGADTFLVGLTAAALQFTAFWFNARRYAVGSQGPVSFLASPQWTPPGGWLLWLALAGLGSLLVALSLIPLTERELETSYGRSGIVVSPSRVSLSR
jgi:hypothetical protein